MLYLVFTIFVVLNNAIKKKNETDYFYFYGSIVGY
ncbi:hypothetical protein M2135_000987 [Parabacteroides sp. PF5-9]|nr:hypothetical protein [Parabacteroides sp. PF5-9]